jgi:hypothetical protein
MSSDPNLQVARGALSCPYFKEGYFGICVALDAIHVPSIAEMETFCFRVFYERCPTFTASKTLESRDNLILRR